MSIIPIHLTALILSAGYAGLFAVIFAESGLFFGFFLPGDSLLFAAGLLGAQGHLSLAFLIPILAAAAILGDSVGYLFGNKVGPALFSRRDSLFFHRRHLERTREFFARWGAPAVVLARFVPVVRTFAPILAGIGEMPYRRFFIYNAVGGLAWSAGFTLLGYFLGRLFPQIEHYLLLVSVVIIIISLLPVAREIWRARKENRTESGSKKLDLESFSPDAE